MSTFFTPGSGYGRLQDRAGRETALGAIAPGASSPSRSFELLLPHAAPRRALSVGAATTSGATRDGLEMGGQKHARRFTCFSLDGPTTMTPRGRDFA